MSSSPYKRSACGQSKERKDDPAKRHKPGSSSPPDDPPSLSSSMQPNNSQAAVIGLLENYINKAIQTIRSSLKPFLKHDYPVCVLKKLDIKIRERIHSAICDKVIDSDAQVLHLYRARYSFPSDRELLKSVLHEYGEVNKKQAMVNKINKSAQLTDMKPLPYSDDLAKSLSNESIFTKVNSLADEVMTQAAQRQIMTELYEANNNIKHLPKDCIDEFTEIIRSTLNSLDKRDSEWHWTKIYELYRKDCTMKSDERQLLEICKAHGFKIPITTKPIEHLYLDLKPPKQIITATNVIYNDLKMAVKTTCVHFNDLPSFLVRHYIGGIIKTIVGDEYFTIEPSSRINVLVLSYRQYRSVDDDIELFKKFENELTERTRRDTSSKELVSELHFWKNDNLTSNCFFDMVKITMSKIIGYILQYQDASLYHINYLIYDIRSELMKLTYKRKKNKWALTYSEKLLEFQNYSKSKLNFYMDRYVFIKSTIPDDSTIEKINGMSYSPKHEELRQVVCNILKEKLDSIFDKGIELHREELKSDSEGNINKPKKPATAENMQSGASGHKNNIICGSLTAEYEQHAKFQNVEVTSQVESILKTNIIEMTRLKTTFTEQTDIDRNHDPSQSQAGSIVEEIPIESADTKQIIYTKNSNTICPGGTETSRIGMITSEPLYGDKQTNDGNEFGILNQEIALNIMCKPTNQCMTVTKKPDSIVTIIKSESIEDYKMEEDIFSPTQEMISNIIHEQITQDKDITEFVKEENVECGMKNDTLLSISLAREVNEPEIVNKKTALNIMCKPTNRRENMSETEKQDNIVTYIKSEPIVEDDEMENDIFLSMPEITLNIKNEQITQDKDETEIVRKENVECGMTNNTLLSISLARDVNEPEILNKEIALNIMCKPTNRRENMTETEKQDNIGTYIKSEPIVENVEMENDNFLPMQEITLNIKNEQITHDKDETEIVRKENVECGMINNTLLSISLARDVNEPEILNKEIALNIMCKPTNRRENMTETEKQDNIGTYIKSEPIVEDVEMENDNFLPMQEITLNIKNEQITHDKDETEIVRKENVECGMTNNTLLSISLARDVNEPEILNKEIALNIMCKPKNQCENMSETENQDNIVTNIKSEPIVEDNEMENNMLVEYQTTSQAMGLKINSELINEDENVKDTVEHKIIKSAEEINTTEDHLPSTHFKIRSIKTEILNPDDKVIQDLSIEMNGINSYSTMDSFFTKVETELEPDTGNTLKEEDDSTNNVKNVAAENVDASTSSSQTLSSDTNMTLGEEETLNSASYSFVTTIHKIVDEYLFSVIPNLKKKLVSTMLNDNMLVNSFDKQLPKTDSQLIRLTGEPRLPALVKLLQFLKQFNPESIKLRKNSHNTLYVQTTDWSKLLEIGEVTIDGNKLLIEKENYCKKLVDITLDPDAIYLIKSLDKWNTEFVDQASQTFTRLVVRKRKPTSDNTDASMENNVTINSNTTQVESNNIPLMNNSDPVIGNNVPITISDSTPVIHTEPTNNNITGISNGTTKNKKKKKRIRKTKIYIDNEEFEQLPRFTTEDTHESTHEVTTEDEFDKIINDLDPELEDLLNAIKETENQPASQSTL